MDTPAPYCQLKDSSQGEEIALGLTVSAHVGNLLTQSPLILHLLWVGSSCGGREKEREEILDSQNIRKIPWSAASSELSEHFAQFGHIKRCNVPFDRETGFHRGMGWVQFSSQEELQNALQQENHVIDGVTICVQAQKPKVLQGAQTSDEEKDF
ncbi:SRA stem-loop-interacting RNA-binding protein, mitochondrial-like [Arvicola amphibius]|uniref:SRA stem-loop-interacting RNA-binding protein, mitochondrial-like n=1 Tax=Arvicola amphibius TaxID=1047088 RepID=UPI0018E2A6FC|nr:SRA stem-loop-interacting RNA-binding protein, mitochondrial-like [Arvicola amphibius]